MFEHKHNPGTRSLLCQRHSSVNKDVQGKITDSRQTIRRSRHSRHRGLHDLHYGAVIIFQKEQSTQNELKLAPCSNPLFVGHFCQKEVLDTL